MAAPTKAARQRVHSLLQAVADDVAKLPVGVMQDIRHPLAQARAELEKGLATLLRQYPDGGETFGAHHLRNALRQVNAALEALDEVAPAMKGGLAKGASRAAGMSNANLEKEVARLSDAFGGDLPQLQLPTVAQLMDRNSWLLTRFDKQAQRYTKGAKDSIRSQFAIGVAKNETIDQLTNRIMRLGGKRKGYGMQTEGVAAKMSDGLFAGRYSDAERLVRTEMMNTYNAHHQRALEDSGMKKRWDATADGRLCGLCREMDGEVRGADEEFSSGQMYPPRHPNCRCVVVPWSDDWPKLTSLPPLETRTDALRELSGTRPTKTRRKT